MDSSPESLPGLSGVSSTSKTLATRGPNMNPYPLHNEVVLSPCGVATAVYLLLVVTKNPTMSQRIRYIGCKEVPISSRTSSAVHARWLGSCVFGGRGIEQT